MSMTLVLGVSLVVGMAPVADDAAATADGSPAVAAYELAEEARSHERAGRWAEAERAWAAVTARNPYDSFGWYRYAVSLSQQQKYDAAGDAFRQSFDLGGIAQLHDAAIYNAACCHSLAGRTDDAFAALEIAMTREIGMDEELVRNDTDLDPIRSDPRFAVLVPIEAPTGLSRDEAWRHDLDVFERRMKALHYRLDAVTPTSELEEAIERLRHAVPDKTDDDIRLGIQRLLVMVGDGHTGLRTWPSDVGRLPVALYWYADGVFIRATSPAHTRLLGRRVVSIGGVPISDALALVEPLVARDNRIGLLNSPGLLTRLDVLRHLGLAEGDEPVSLTLEDGNGAEEVVHLTPTTDAPAWVEAHEQADAPRPLYLRDTSTPYWFEHLPEHALVYLKHNSCGSMEREPFAEFCARLMAFIEDEDVEHLVIDERHNGGGSSDFNVHLVHAIIRSDRINRPGHLFVITGRRTFSAGMNMVTDLDVMTKAIFAGEPPASRPNFIGEGLSFTLPCSGIRVGCSTRLHQRGSSSADRRHWITPALYAPLSSADYVENRDPVMEAILAFIQRP